jgi:formylglycine-generating enzyme required for sulfatase activity
MRAPFLGVVLLASACAGSEPFDEDAGPVRPGHDDIENPTVPILLAAGTFHMGCNPDASPDGTICDPGDAPYRAVTLSRYDIDPAEVSRWAYFGCVQAGRCSIPAPSIDSLDIIDLGDYPVVGVTWDQAAAYCAYMGRRLPTEAEWERAARGDDGRTWPWGEQAPDCGRANYGPCARPPARVYSMREGAHPMGTLHMADNVAEWVADWYAEPAGTVDPQGPASGTARVVRGGSYLSEAHQLRTWYRAAALPGAASATIGFRCAGGSGASAPGVD